jgi:hypothetical protein
MQSSSAAAKMEKVDETCIRRAHCVLAAAAVRDCEPTGRKSLDPVKNAFTSRLEHELVF